MTYDPDEDSRRSYEVAIAALRQQNLAARALIADSRAGRTDEQALWWLAEMVLALKAAASPGYIRAKQGAPPRLDLDDREPVT